MSHADFINGMRAFDQGETLDWDHCRDWRAGWKEARLREQVKRSLVSIPDTCNNLEHKQGSTP
jgi:hypothetical protein